MGDYKSVAATGRGKKMEYVIILVCLSIPEFQVPRVLNWCVFLLEVVPLLFFFLVTTTHTQGSISLSFYLIYRTFWELFFQYSCCYNNYTNVVIFTLFHRLVVIVLASFSPPVIPFAVIGGGLTTGN